MEYLFAWRRREAVRVVRRYEFLVAPASDRYRPDQARAPQPGSAPVSDRIELLRPVTILKDCA